MRTAIAFCILGLLVLGCSKSSTSAEEVSVSYVFERADGVVLKDRRSKRSISETKELLPELLKGLGDASGRIVLRFSLSEGATMEHEARIVDGKMDGLCKTFVGAEGKRLLVSEVTYVGDRKDGPTIAYFPGEGVMYEGSWSADQKSGDWILYYRNGGRAVSARLRDDHFDGPVQILDASGEEIASGIYDVGREIDGTFIDDPWALVASITQYGDKFATRRFRCVSGVKSEEESIEILKEAKKTEPNQLPEPTAASGRGSS